MNTPANLRYSATHEWLEDIGGGKFRIGLTDFAQDSLGDLVFVNLPEAGDPLTAGEAFGDVESVKAVSDVISPVTASVSAVNEEAADSPETINESPYTTWLVEVEDVMFTEKLMDADEYAAFCANEA